MYVPIAGPEGNVWVDEVSLTEDELSILGSHRNAIGAYLADPDDLVNVKRVSDHEGVEIAGVQLVTDLDRIDELDAQDRLAIEQFYEEGPPS